MFVQQFYHWQSSLRCPHSVMFTDFRYRPCLVPPRHSLHYWHHFCCFAYLRCHKGKKFNMLTFLWITWLLSRGELDLWNTGWTGRYSGWSWSWSAFWSPASSAQATTTLRSSSSLGGGFYLHLPKKWFTPTRWRWSMMDRSRLHMSLESAKKCNSNVLLRKGPPPHILKIHPFW